MPYYDTHPNASHRSFPYYFDDDEGITFGDLPVASRFYYDLAIFYGNLDINSGNFVEGGCSRWDVDNYSVTVSSWIKKEEVDNLRLNILPGAVGELYKILGRPKYYDKSWQGYNTVRLYPTLSSQIMNGSNLKNMRSDTIIYVKNYTEHTIDNSDWIEIKLEGYVSGTTHI